MSKENGFPASDWLKTSADICGFDSHNTENHTTPTVC